MSEEIDWKSRKGFCQWRIDQMIHTRAEVYCIEAIVALQEAEPREKALLDALVEIRDHLYSAQDRDLSSTPNPEIGWQDIESAPKGNGGYPGARVDDPGYIEPPRILAIVDGEIVITYWDWYYAKGGRACTDGMAWVDIQTGDPCHVAPTLWMPLPLPPVDTPKSRAEAI